MAHIPDGFLSAPVVIGTAAASVGALAVAARRSSALLGEREAPLLGAATAFVFAAQMLNFPIGAGTSAHLLGGVLVAAVLGPWAAMLVLFAVLLVQALLFQDGGIAALGANVLNLAVISVGGGYGMYRWVLALLGPGCRARAWAAGIAAYFSTALVGLAVALEVALSGVVPLHSALAVIGGSHLVVGLGEAGITAAIVGMLARGRPELLEGHASPTPVGRRVARAVTAAAALLALAAAYLASTRPDALERAAERLGLTSSEGGYLRAVFPGYEAPGAGAWLAAAVGVFVVFALGYGLARLVVLRRTRV